MTTEVRSGIVTAVNVYAPRRGPDGVQVLLRQEKDVDGIPVDEAVDCVRRWAAYVTQWNNHALRDVIVCANEALNFLNRLNEGSTPCSGR